ncbi:triple tyrosine motif-containing protein [Sphingobacterium sp.]|uniref:triple tyrosine motif-containing protein n=1 Tax=Sphingobacterium sp. TaxID=341027 RepID=UPI0028A777F2|nr:triple tyrosine motif-containing protein [Sphingobacterium sp.]
MKLLKYFLVILLFVGHFIELNGQNIPRVGSPYVQQYSKTVYHAGNQNWGIAVSPEGMIYSANTEGLLQYDGQEWELYRMKNHAGLRSVNIDPTGRIFVGGAGEFGYWSRSDYGKMEYSSLSGLVNDQQALKNDEIWRIIIDADKIYFHTFSKSYLYQNNQIKTITADGEPFLFGFQVNGKMYFEQLPSGLHELHESRLIAIKDKHKLLGYNILAMLPYSSNEVLIGTDRNGVYKMNSDGSMEPWKTEAQDLLKKYQINNAVKLFGNQYAFGTIQNGVIIVNQAGEIVQHINKNNGLQNNTVLSLAVDKQSNLWVGLDNGIDRIDINSPLYYYSDLTGNIGTVYSSIIFDDKIYLGTNQGLFVSDWQGVNDYKSLNFRIVPNSQGQVWKLANIKGQLICGHNNGTFVVEGNSMRRVSSVTGAWDFVSMRDSKYWLQANYTGVSLMQSDPSASFVKQFSYKKDPIRNIMQIGPESFWLSNSQNVFSFKLSPNFQDALEFKLENNGLPKGSKLHGIYNLANNIVFASDSGFYLYDNILRAFKPYEELNSQLASFASANKIIPIHNNAYWFIKRSHLAKIQFLSDGKLKIDSSSWNSLKGRMMNDYEQVLNVDENLSLIGLDNGFALYFNQYPVQQNIPKPIITSIWNTTAEPYSIYDELEIPNKENNIRFSFASAWYSSSALKYQYYLEGYTESWSTWEEIAFKDFTNLPFGSYTFQVRAITPNGIKSEITSVSFKVLPPWYLSWPAILAYFIALAAVIYFGKRWYENRLLEHQRRVKKKLLEEQEERMAREAAANEKKLISLKNLQLEQELESKNRELANAAMNIVYKNEMLNNLHHELTNLNDSSGNKLSNDQLRKVNKLIDEAHSDDRDWDLFEKSFNEAHENFFKKLKSEYPSLVPNDLKLCAYLRLNMSSKEIASLLNISTRGVEIRRYRLRKKLNLPTNKNLTEFLLEM